MGILLRLAIAAFLHVVLFVGANETFPQVVAGGAAPDAAQRFLALFAVGAAHSVALAILVRASSTRGIALLGALTLVYGSVFALLPAAREALFGVPAAAWSRLVITGIQVVGWLPAATWLMARWAGPPPPPTPRAELPRWLGARWLGLGVVALALSVIGDVALSREAPEVAAYFGRLTAEPARMAFVAGRGLVLALLAAPLVRALRGPWWARGLGLGFALAAFEAAPWAVPDSLLGAEVRLPVLASKAIAAALFGVMVSAAWIAGTSGPRAAARRA